MPAEGGESRNPQSPPQGGLFFLIISSRAVIFANGEVKDLAAVQAILRPDDFRIAADGGMKHLSRLGLLPQLLIGDLDSISAGEVEWLVQAGIQVEHHPPAKDETDLELAVAYASQAGYREVVVIGALGGRIDQSLGNIFLLSDPRFSAM
ncbi:MAG TPA: thiamine diphosphokinase, partial [Candidatus Methylomirabilis sp.]|nr:thiamine diphosphokinase [Candidatus Methylomirabilis sp.]